MAATKEDALLLLRLDEVHGPGVAARKFAYSSELAAVVEEGSFFETYALDSDERFHVNAVATYFELLGSFVRLGLVDEELAREWAGAMFYWKLLGPVLVQAREVFENDLLWTDFEALAEGQATAG